MSEADKVMADVREKIAQTIHLEERVQYGSSVPQGGMEWDKLSENEKEAFRIEADQILSTPIPIKRKCPGYGGQPYLYKKAHKVSCPTCKGAGYQEPVVKTVGELIKLGIESAK